MIINNNNNSNTNFKSWTPRAQEILIKNAEKLGNTQIETIASMQKNPHYLYDLKIGDRHPDEIIFYTRCTETKTTIDMDRDSLEGHLECMDIAEQTSEQPNTFSLQEKLEKLKEIFATKPEK